MVEYFLEELNGNIARLKCYAECKKDRVFYIEIDIENKELLKTEGEDAFGYAGHATWSSCDKYKETGVFPEHGVSVWG